MGTAERELLYTLLTHLPTPTLYYAMTCIASLDEPLHFKLV